MVAQATRLRPGPYAPRMNDLAGKPIAITGASSGIGRATALACVRAGMPVAVSARREDRLRALADEISRLGGRAIAVPGDVDNDADAQRLVDRTVESFGSIHAIFANAGYGLEKRVHETSEAELRAIFETNFFGTIRTLRPALARMIEARSGHVLICSSCLAKFAPPLSGVYAATKGAQSLIARSMKVELAPLGVRVSSVHPIGTRTEFFDSKAIRKGEPGSMSRTPSVFMQPPERVARAIVACLRRPRAEVWTSTPARLFFGLAGTFPSIGEWAMRRVISPTR